MFASLDLEPRLSFCLVARLVDSLSVCCRRTCPFLDLARYVRDELNPCINAFIGKWVLILKESTELTLLSLSSFLVSTGRRWDQLVPSSCLDLVDDQVLSSSSIGGLRPLGHRNRPSRVAVLVQLERVTLVSATQFCVRSSHPQISTGGYRNVIVDRNQLCWPLGCQQFRLCTFVDTPDFDRVGTCTINKHVEFDFV